MNTAAKRRLLAAATAARRDWRHVEQTCAALGDPELIEHACIAQLAMLHVADRALFLQQDEECDQLEEAVGA